MTTSKSPRKVLKLAYELAREALPDFGSRFSRHDFTNAQLFACLVLREHQRKSFRGIEALLRDSPLWLADIGLSKSPDHNTLCRAFDRFVKPQLAWTVLDLMAELAQQRGTTKRGSRRRHKPLAIDSSMFESRHVSRHFERRCKKSPGRWGKSVNRKRRRVVGRLPKLSLACDSATHLILSATASTGAGADQPFFDDLLYHAWRRSPTRVRHVVADAGYDSEANHRIARLDLRVRSIIPPRAGRPTKTPGQPPPPEQPLRRAMYHRFARKLDRALYGQRWQSETVNSMIKRNLGSALRARTTVHRRHELLLRVLTHNIMLLAEG